jgi:hypothetical protein
LAVKKQSLSIQSLPRKKGLRVLSRFRHVKKEARPYVLLQEKKKEKEIKKIPQKNHDTLRGIGDRVLPDHGDIIFYRPEGS